MAGRDSGMGMKIEKSESTTRCSLERPANTCSLVPRSSGSTPKPVRCGGHCVQRKMIGSGVSLPKSPVNPLRYLLRDDRPALIPLPFSFV